MDWQGQGLRSINGLAGPRADIYYAVLSALPNVPFSLHSSCFYCFYPTIQSLSEVLFTKRSLVTSQQGYHICLSFDRVAHALTTQFLFSWYRSWSALLNLAVRLAGRIFYPPSLPRSCCTRVGYFGHLFIYFLFYFLFWLHLYIIFAIHERRRCAPVQRTYQVRLIRLSHVIYMFYISVYTRKFLGL